MTTGDQIRDTICVDEIVRRVLERLGHRPAAATVRSSAACGELHLPGRVVTLTDVQSRLIDVRTIVVRQDAVVTPAVADYLRECQVELRRGGAEADQHATSSLMIGATTSIPRTVQTAMQAAGIRLQPLQLPTLCHLLDKLAKRVDSGQRPVVVWTREVHTAVCLANRYPEMRAAAARSAADVRSAAAEVGANLFVVSPAAADHAQTVEILTTVFGLGAVACPRGLQSLLSPSVPA